MKIIVCIEPHGPGAASRAALALARGIATADSVTALSVGSPGAHAGTMQARALGAGRTVHVAAAALEAADAAAVGRVLALAAGRLGAELLLAGVASDDEGLGLVPAAVAHQWEVPVLCGVESLILEAGIPIATIRAGGYKRHLAMVPPAVLAVTPNAGAGGPGRGKIAGGRPDEVIALGDLGVDPETLAPQPSHMGEMVRSRRRPVTVKSADELVRRWLGPPGGK